MAGVDDDAGPLTASSSSMMWLYVVGTSTTDASGKPVLKTAMKAVISSSERFFKWTITTFHSCVVIQLLSLVVLVFSANMLVIGPRHGNVYVVFPRHEILRPYGTSERSTDKIVGYRVLLSERIELVGPLRNVSCVSARDIGQGLRCSSFLNNYYL